MTNDVATNQGVSKALSNPKILEKFESIMGEQAGQFIAGVQTVTNNNTLVAEVGVNEIVNQSMKAAVLGLSVLPEFGEAYLIPYKASKKVGNTWTKAPELQVQLGYKGLIKLALNSGRVAKIRAVEIYAGDKPVFNRITGELNYTLGYDPDTDLEAEVVGYLGMYTDMQTHEIVQEYWSKAKVEAHAIKYSQSYSGAGAVTKYGKSETGPWTTNFDAMAKKTVLKALLKFAPKSTDDKLFQALNQDDSAEYASRKDITPVYDEPAKLETQAYPEPEEVASVAPEVPETASKAVEDEEPVNTQQVLSTTQQAPTVDEPTAKVKDEADLFFEQMTEGL